MYLSRCRAIGRRVRGRGKLFVTFRSQKPNASVTANANVNANPYVPTAIIGSVVEEKTRSKTKHGTWQLSYRCTLHERELQLELFRSVLRPRLLCSSRAKHVRRLRTTHPSVGCPAKETGLPIPTRVSPPCSSPRRAHLMRAGLPTLGFFPTVEESNLRAEGQGEGRSTMACCMIRFRPEPRGLESHGQALRRWVPSRAVHGSRYLVPRVQKGR
ncbi:hypothetical protein BJ546DRAFT_961847 [Cryomyces antarcticus]